MKKHAAPETIIGRHHLLVFHYNYAELERFIAKYAERCTGNSWPEVAEKLSRLGHWEFEDSQGS